MRNTLGLLELDTEPFATLQLDVTGFPSILFEVATLFANRSRAYHVILDTLEFFLDVSVPHEIPEALSDTKFTGYLLRHKAGKPDDFFKVCATEDGGFALTYTYRGVGADQTSELLLSSDDARRWLTTLLELLGLDTDPFAELQLSVTGFPDILLTVSEIKDNQLSHHIDDAASRVLDTLDYFLDTVERPEPVENEDEEEDEEEDFIPVPRETADLDTEAYSTDSEDEYADMPALISANQCAMDEYAAYRYSTWAPKNQHLFFDDCGRVIDCC
jgi:hypothetical protein